MTSAFLAMAALCVTSLIAGCGTPKSTPLTPEDRQPYTDVGIQPGDVLRIMFPAAPAENLVQQVQSDGTIALPGGSALRVQGKTAPEVERAILDVYGDKLVVKSVVVTVESVGFPVFVSGAVSRPGRILCKKSITLLEALAEAGGAVEGRADLRRVKVVRQRDDGTTYTYQRNVKAMLTGEDGEQFYLRPSDVVYVPERLSFY
jgi:protein involved in polysaccharide export with SLBB domain